MLRKIFGLEDSIIVAIVKRKVYYLSYAKLVCFVLDNCDPIELVTNFFHLVELNKLLHSRHKFKCNSLNTRPVLRKQPGSFYCSNQHRTTFNEKRRSRNSSANAVLKPSQQTNCCTSSWDIIPKLSSHTKLSKIHIHFFLFKVLQLIVLQSKFTFQTK